MAEVISAGSQGPYGQSSVLCHSLHIPFFPAPDYRLFATKMSSASDIVIGPQIATVPLPVGSC